MRIVLLILIIHLAQISEQSPLSDALVTSEGIYKYEVVLSAGKEIIKFAFNNLKNHPEKIALFDLVRMLQEAFQYMSEHTEMNDQEITHEIRNKLLKKIAFRAGGTAIGGL